MKNRPARVRVCLSHLIHNCRLARARAPGRSLMAVIKADAYGHGAGACAEVLAKEADSLAVATIGEALALREGGVSADLVVLHGARAPQELARAIEHKLELVVHDADQIRLLEQAAFDGPGPLLWLKIDTGMGRLGIRAEQAAACLERLQALAWNTQPVRLMTHLSCADESGDSATQEQLARFAEVAGGGARSAANSAALLRYPESHLDWVRPGLMLYGVTPANCPPADLRAVMTLEAPLLTVRECRAGDRLGYGGTYVCPANMRVGLIEAGYADGYPHASGGRTEVAIGDARHRTLGRVSMDLIAIDLTGSDAGPGDWVELWGAHLPVAEVAAESSTIAYELLARAGHLRHEYRDPPATSTG